MRARVVGRGLLSSVLVVLLVTPACRHRSLAPADATAPAAGVCERGVGAVVEVALEVDVPAPRCVRVRDGQRLRVVNHTTASVTVRLGGERVVVGPGDAATIERGVGDYLARGVHRMRTDGYVPGGPEVWVQ